MLKPISANGTSGVSNTQAEPKSPLVTHVLSATFTTNQPGPAGESPDWVSSSRASSTICLLSLLGSNHRIADRGREGDRSRTLALDGFAPRVGGRCRAREPRRLARGGGIGAVRVARRGRRPGRPAAPHGSRSFLAVGGRARRRPAGLPRPGDR